MWRYVVRKDQENTTADSTFSIENPEASSNVGHQHVQPSTSSATGDDQNIKKTKAKKTRKFNPSWQHAFPWVKLVNHKMFCDICTKDKHADKKSTFVTGSDNFHLKSLRKHSLSKGHANCAEKAKAHSAPPGTNPAEKALQVLHEKQFEKMRVLFRVSHSLAKKGRPFSDYEWSLDLHEATHHVNLGETYRNDRASRKFIAYIAEAERLNLASELSVAPFYSVMTDGTTDASICEAEIMFVRYCSKGKLSNRFLALRNLDRANAENIVKVIEDSLTKVGGIPDEDLYPKAVGYGADGASVNMGYHSGVGKRLMDKQPLITVVHCMAHRLELAFKDVLKEGETQLEVVNFPVFTTFIIQVL